MQAIKNKVIFKPNYTEVLRGGLIVPNSCKKRDSSGVVVSVGVGTKDKPMEYAPKDLIYYIQGAGTEIEHNGEVFYVIDDFNILCKKINNTDAKN